MSKTNEHAFLQHALLVTGTHHEKWDGSGYPTGLRGMNIPLEGRLMAIADVYDALIAVRPYKKAMPAAQAADVIKAGGGTHFDPQLVDIFDTVFDRFADIANELHETHKQKQPITPLRESAGTEVLHQNLRSA